MLCVSNCDISCPTRLASLPWRPNIFYADTTPEKSKYNIERLDRTWCRFDFSCISVVQYQTRLLHYILRYSVFAFFIHIYFSTPFSIFALIFSFLLVTQIGGHLVGRLSLLPPPHHGSCLGRFFYREKTSALSSVVGLHLTN